MVNRDRDRSHVRRLRVHHPHALQMHGHCHRPNDHNRMNDHQRVHCHRHYVRRRTHVRRHRRHDSSHGRHRSRDSNHGHRPIRHSRPKEQVHTQGVRRHTRTTDPSRCRNMHEVRIRHRSRIREPSRSTLEAPTFQALEEARPMTSKFCASFSFTSLIKTSNQSCSIQSQMRAESLRSSSSRNASSEQSLREQRGTIS